MSNKRILGLACSAAMMLGGCATGTGQSGDVTSTGLQNGTTALGTGAETRLIFSSPNLHNTPEHPARTANITCAEPSPDIAKIASEAFSASVRASASGPIFGNGGSGDANAAAALGNARAEHIAELGRRLATVQLVRDSLFRACEAYANGAIDENMYAIVTSRFDDVMVALFATEMAQGGQSPESIIVSSADALGTGFSRERSANVTTTEDGGGSRGGEDTNASLQDDTGELTAGAAALGRGGPVQVNAQASAAGAQAVAQIADAYLTSPGFDAVVVACVAELGRQPADRQLYIEPQGDRWANNLLAACLHPTAGILTRAGEMYAQTMRERLEIEHMRAEADLLRARAEANEH